MSAFIDWCGTLKVFVTSRMRSSPESKMADSTLRTRSDSTGRRGAWRGAGGRDILRVLQAGRRYAIYPIPPQPIGCFDQPAHKQALEYSVNLGIPHSCRNLYLDGIGCIFARDRRQHALLVTRQHG